MIHQVKINIIKLPYSFKGGAWKVAYADFVTAMMAFFLLMWLLNATTKEQKNAISDYFSPSHPQVSDTVSGAGGVLGGLTMTPEGAMASTKNQVIPPQESTQRKRGDLAKSTVAQKRAEAEQKRFKEVAQKLREAIKKNKELAKLEKNILIDETAEGLRIQIVDQDGEPMFPPASAEMFEKTKLLLEQITELTLDMPNELSIRGHTDGARYAAGAKYTNWELSSDRANASRRVIMGAGMPLERINNVMGKAATEPFVLENPLDARNRRITIILLRQDITNPLPPEEGEEDDFVDSGLPGIPAEPYQKTPGAVEFP